MNTTPKMDGVYRGIRRDGGLMIESFSYGYAPLWGVPLGLIDLPLSFVADTLILPWDIADLVAESEHDTKQE